MLWLINSHDQEASTSAVPSARWLITGGLARLTAEDTIKHMSLKVKSWGYINSPLKSRAASERTVIYLTVATGDAMILGLFFPCTACAKSLTLD